MRRENELDKEPTGMPAMGPAKSTSPVTIHLPTELCNRLKDAARDDDRSVSHFVTRILRRALLP